jgi:acetyl-CoA carboxylase carboxyl transferase subunit beta
MADRIDVVYEDKRPKPETERKHPNTCPRCNSHFKDEELAASLYVCTHCGHHFPMKARARIASVVDADSFVEEAAEMRSADPLDFVDLRPYKERLAEAELSSDSGEAMIIGQGAIEELPVELAVMDFSFIGGSMGSVVGEKFAMACDHAAERGIPLVSIPASGGARMQEGIFSLMQMPKTVCAIEDLRDAGGTLLTVVTHPTTGGVIASYASLGDVTLAEPGALMSFAGPRVVQQTVKEDLPADFGRSESNVRFGHVDAIVPRPELRATLAKLLRLFEHESDHES